MEKNMLKKIILEQSENMSVNTSGVIARDAAVLLQITNKHAKHALIITGIRRCGKSTYMNTLRKEYGYDKTYYFSFEDERLINFNSNDLNTLFECLLELYGDRKYFFFDEIQNIQNWEPFVRRQQDAGYKFYITGSNASLLSRELGTKLTGRNMKIELFPFSFNEYLRFQKAETTSKTPLTTRQEAAIKRHFNRWLKNGGMPEYLKYDDSSMLKHVYDDILFRDIAVRYRIKNVKALRELSLYLISNIGREFSYNSAARMLGLGSMNTVKNFTDHLENSYLIFTVGKFSYSLKKQFVSAKKVYCIDNGIASTVAFGTSEDKGRFLENSVFMELTRRNPDIYYYKTAKGKEVDFLVRKSSKDFELYQVCYDISSQSTRTREISALEDAMKDFNLKKSFIITDNCQETLKTPSGTIEMIPAYKWMTGLK